jgi:thiol-disulfide isomerase/thioredoxin
MAGRRGLRIAVIAVAGVAGLAAGLWFARMPWDRSLRPGGAPKVDVTSVGQLMPTISLPDLQGKSVVLPDHFAGQPLLINVWASWCGPCVEEMPALTRFAASQSEHGVQVIGLALDTPEAVTDFLERVPVDYPIVLDTPGPADASVALGNSRGLLPYTVLVDAQGRIAKQKLGPFAEGDIEPWASTE